MKKIEAIIRRTKFDDVKEALLKADIEWFSYYDNEINYGQIYKRRHAYVAVCRNASDYVLLGA